MADGICNSLSLGAAPTVENLGDVLRRVCPAFVHGRVRKLPDGSCWAGALVEQCESIMKKVVNGLLQDWEISAGLYELAEEVRIDWELRRRIGKRRFNNCATPQVFKSAMLAVRISIPLL
jgi:hypothetical protein